MPTVMSLTMSQTMLKKLFARQTQCHRINLTTNFVYRPANTGTATPPSPASDPASLTKNCACSDRTSIC